MPVEKHLAELTRGLDAAWRQMADRMAEAGPDAKVEVVVPPEGGRARLSVDKLGAVDEPESLTWLKKTTAAMLPQIDLPDLLFEVHSWTGFLDAFTHVSEGASRMAGLPVSLVALLVAEACNIGLTPVTNSNHVELTRLAQRGQRPGVGDRGDGGAGHSARQPVHPGHSAQPRRRGEAGDGRDRPRLVLRHGVRTVQDAGLPVLPAPSRPVRPAVLAGGVARRARRHAGTPADYGPLGAIARNKVNLDKVITHWPDMLRVAGSLITNQVRAYDLLRVFGREGRMSPLGQAFAEYGRIDKTMHLLALCDPVDDTYRRRMNRQLTVQETRHRLARAICHGRRGQIMQAYREGQEDQLAALGLVLNAVVLWTTRYLDAAVTQLEADGHVIDEADKVRLSLPILIRIGSLLVECKGDTDARSSVRRHRASPRLAGCPPRVRVRPPGRARELVVA